MGTLNLSSTASLTPSILEAPAFYVARSTGQSISDQTWTKIELTDDNSGAFDTNGCWDNSNHRFTPTLAGYYQIQFTCAVSSGLLWAGRIAIYKNGSAWNQAEFYDSNANSDDKYDDLCLSVSGLIYFNGTTDYVEFFAWRREGSGGVGGSSDRCQASGFLARQA